MAQLELPPSIPVQPWKPKKPTPVEGGGTLNAGIQNNPWTMKAGIPLGQTPLYGGGGLSGALQGAYNDTTNEFNQAIGGNLAPNDPRFGGFGAMLQNLATNPQGFGPDVMKRIMTRLAEREAGVRGNSERAIRDAGGQNFSSFGDVLANMQGQSASRLSEAELNAEIQDAMLRQTSRGQGISGGVSLANILAGLNSQQASFAANRQRPLIEAGGTGPGGKYDLLNESGEMINFHEDGTPLSAFERERQRQQRMAWMNSQGG